MEIFGLIWITGVALVFSTIFAVILWFYQPTRPFSLSVWTTPPIAVSSLILIRWLILDRSPVCGPDPEWDRCPSARDNAFTWAAWLLLVVLVATVVFVVQKLVTSYVNTHLDRKLQPSTAIDDGQSQ